MLLDVSELHAGEHFATLGTESWALESLGLVRGLGTPAFAALFLALAAVGWWGWRRALAGRWWAGTLAGATLVFLLVFMDNRNYPRYWVLVWLLLATPAVAGAALLGRSRAAGLAASGVGLLAAVAWGFPAVRHIHRHRLPVVAALDTAAGEGPGVLIYEDQLFSFRNLAAVSGRLPVDSLRLTEMRRAGPRIAGRPALAPGGGAGRGPAVPDLAGRRVRLPATRGVAPLAGAVPARAPGPEPRAGGPRRKSGRVRRHPALRLVRRPRRPAGSPGERPGEPSRWRSRCTRA